MIHIAHDERKRAFLSRGLRKVQRNPVIEGAAIRNSSEPVLLGKRLEALIRYRELARELEQLLMHLVQPLQRAHLGTQHNCAHWFHQIVVATTFDGTLEVLVVFVGGKKND